MTFRKGNKRETEGLNDLKFVLRNVRNRKCKNQTLFIIKLNTVMLGLGRVGEWLTLSHQEDSGFELVNCGLLPECCMFSQCLHWVPPGVSSRMQIRVTGSSKLPIDLNVNVCTSPG